MSRWWGERIQVAIDADRLVLTKFGRGWRPAMKDQVSITNGDNGSNDWSERFKPLTDLLSTPPWRGGDLDVVLSHKYCRLALLPAGIALRNQREETEFARLRLIKNNGDIPANWEIAVATNSPATPRVACAVDRELLIALDEAARPAKSHVTSVQPYLAAAFNCHRRLLSNRHLWFATLENQRLCLARVQNGHWRSLRVSRQFGLPGETLESSLDHECLLSETDDAPMKVMLCAQNSPEFILSAGSRWQLTHLPLTDAFRDEKGSQ